MNKILSSALLISLAVAFSACSDSSSNTMPKYTTAKDKVTLNVLFADPKWDGKSVPKDEICSDHHKGGGASPALIINNLPPKTNCVILSFSDETFKGMRNGGHGTIGYKVKEGSTTVTIPSIQGETFTLPTGFKSVRKHQGEQFGKQKGAYLPPCSGGHGNQYSVSVKAMQKSADKGKTHLLLGDATLSMGKY
jgi:hypothetical protein